ncbi:hypothetical protein J7E26_17460, partial [Bacillus sp. ISL-51]|nr:hypothetical protein [Bacillus sp. ISL-51]
MSMLAYIVCSCTDEYNDLWLLKKMKKKPCFIERKHGILLFVADEQLTTTKCFKNNMEKVVDIKEAKCYYNKAASI